MKSEIIKKGLEKAPHRSLLNALGLTKWEKDRPFIGIVNSQNDLVPGHIHLDQIADAVKAGVRANGGTPLEFPAIAVCDGIAMNHEGMRYSLVSRELIADSIEVMAMAHALDALVLITNCDKVVPGMLMAAARLNLPSVIISGGPMLAGRFQGRDVDLNTIFEGVGAVQAGRATLEELEELEEAACPGCGSCSGMFIFKMNIRCGDKGMDPLAFCRFQGFCCPVYIIFISASKCTDYRSLYLPGDGLHSIKISRGGDGKPCLNHINIESGQLPGDPQFFLGI